MKTKSRTISLLITIAITLCISNGFSQKKNFTYEQVFSFRGIRPGTTLPRVTGWLDDKYYLESKREEGRQVVMKVDAVSGEASLYLDYEKINEKLPEGFTLQSSEARTED